MVKHDLIETWTDADLAKDQPQTCMTWAEAVEVVGATVQADIEKHETSGDNFKAQALRDAWSIILTGAAR